ncbi:RING-H2 finger protein ATL16 [Malania oleifera]|uniref:RING-H2 finger protein ATL16 n=1 Tax=Malania oleifera TaxID=397392 RepID=UPI0025AE2F51|nr:RING-H2 finger protein ATL16 [Malania oleifera]
MDLVSGNYYLHGSQAPPPMKSQQSSIFHAPLHSSDTSFPIIVIAIIGILATALLLVSYYIFVIKCCLNWHRIDLLRRFSISRGRRHDDVLAMYSPPPTERRGLDESVIRSIPIFQFKKGYREEFGERSFCECAVCLNEFMEEEKLRSLPNCGHAFHIDCIDAWLQSNANCPLCRTSVSITTRFRIEQIVAPTSSPQHPNPYSGSPMGGDEDFVVIELGEDNSAHQLSARRQERLDSGDLLAQSTCPSPMKIEATMAQRKGRKLSHQVSSMGDECINTRAKDERFAIQPIRRSFSLDSSNDPLFYMSIQEIVQKNSHCNGACSSEGSSSRFRRSLFSFGHGRASRSAVLPVNLEP